MLKFFIMAKFEAERGQMFEFMTLEEFDDTWDLNVIDIFTEDNPNHPNGSFQKVSAINKDFPPAYIIKVPGAKNREEKAISFLSQMELVRRTVRDGSSGLPKRDKSPRLFGRIEIFLAANSFYAEHREIVDSIMDSNEPYFEYKDDIYPEESI